MAIKDFFQKEHISCLPMMFFFGEMASQEKEKMDMGTRFNGEETISHPEGPGSYDTD